MIERKPTFDISEEREREIAKLAGWSYEDLHRVRRMPVEEVPDDDPGLLSLEKKWAMDPIVITKR